MISFKGDEQDHHVMEPIYASWGVKACGRGARARERLVAAGRLLIARGADVVIAGCTEIPVVVGPDDLSVPLIDMTDVLVEHVIARCGPHPAEAD